MNARNRAVITILIKISTICGILPSEKPSRLFNSYQILVFSSLLLCGLYSLYNNIMTYSLSKDALDIFIETLSLSITIILSFAFQFSVLWYPQRWRKLNQKLKFGCKSTETGVKHGIFLEMFGYNLFFFGRFSLTTYIIISKRGIRTILENFSRPLVDYCSMIFILTLVHINIVIKKKFFLMNTNLKRANCVQNMRKLYMKSIQLIDDFNSTFGCQIIFITARGICVILQCLHWSLQNTNTKNFNNLTVLFWSWFYSLTVIVSKIYKILNYRLIFYIFRRRW